MRTRAAIGICGLAIALAGCGERSAEPAPNVSEAADYASGAHGLDVVRRELDSAHGRDLFVNKGCVICHSVNGVGGKAGPPLDAEIGAPPIDPLDFAARIWRGAPAMIELQSVELGYSIAMTGDDLAHLAAFAADREAQKKLTLDSVPEPIRASFLDEYFWEVEDWTEMLRRGREGYEPEGAPEEDAPRPPEP